VTHAWLSRGVFGQPQGRNAPREASVGCVATLHLHRYGSRVPITSGDVELAVRRHGRSVFAFDVLEQSSRYEFFESRAVPGAIVPYRRDGSVDIVMGEPLAAQRDLAQVAADYLESRPRHRAFLGFAATRELASAAVAVGASAAQMAAEPEFDPTHFDAHGGSAKKLRQHMRRLKADGATVTAIEPGTASPPAAFRTAADALIAEWSSKVVPEHAYILEIEPWLRCQDKRYFAVMDPGGKRLWSLLIAHPIYASHGWHLCHIVHSPEAPNGVTDLVTASAIECFAREGVRHVTFGPFAAPELGEVLGAGRLVNAALARAYGSFAEKGGYRHAAEFYRKFLPEPWQPRYMVFYPGHHVVRPVLAMLRLTHVFGLHRSH